MMNEMKKETEAVSTYEAFRAQFAEDLKILPITLSEMQIRTFYQFYLDLIEKNKVMNLTAITEMTEVVRKHFVDSLSLILAVPELSEQEFSVLDLGTGAGFPGIPLAIAWPNLKLTLVDSLNKRIGFILEEADNLGLSNIEAIHGRAEDLARNKAHRGIYDMCVSRAVANLSTLSEYCLPFINKNGRFIPYKSGNASEEVKNSEKAMKILCGKVKSEISFSLPGDEGNRVLVVIEKTGDTPARYPRKAGTPSKEPL